MAPEETRAPPGFDNRSQSCSEPSRRSAEMCAGGWPTWGFLQPVSSHEGLSSGSLGPRKTLPACPGTSRLEGGLVTSP